MDFKNNSIENLEAGEHKVFHNQNHSSRVILIGNPGVGKSTLLNSIIGEDIFKSGPCLGRGLTRRLLTHDLGDLTLVDTPGLDDISSRAEATALIADALSVAHSSVKLVFVVTLEIGRVRNSDLTTIDLVISALQIAGIPMANHFSVIINKCEPAVLDLFESCDAGNYDVHAYFDYICKVSHFVALPVFSHAVGMSDVLLPFQNALIHFVRDAPTYEIDNDVNVLLEADVFERRKKQLEEEICQLRYSLKLRHGHQRNISVAGMSEGLVVDDKHSSLQHGTQSDMVQRVQRFALEWLGSIGTVSLRILRLKAEYEKV